MNGFKDWLQKNEGFGPYIGGCGPHKNFIVMGACSDQNTDAQNRRISAGDLSARFHARRRKKRGK